MASPPKPWERPGATAATSAPIPSTTAAVPAVSTTTAASPASSTAPPVPDRPTSLTSTVNQNASAYSRAGAMGMGASPYSAYGSAYSSPYSSPYSRFGGMGGMGGYGGGMYGGYGGYGGGMYGGMYGGGMGGMNPNDPNSLTTRFSNGTAATFQMLEGIVTAFGGFAQMLESTYMATHSSFFAMVSVAEQFGNLRDALGSILGIFTLMRWIRTLIAKITGRPPPADATALTPAAFARFEGRPGPDGAPGPAKASRKPLFFFLAAAFGLPYLMSKMIRTLAASQEEEERRLQQQALEAQQPVDPSKLEFCRLMYDYLPQGNNSSMELEARKGDLVAVLTKNDPVGNPSEWWQCRARDGRQGYLPSTYLEVLKRPGQEVKKLKAAPSDSSRANSLTSSSEALQEGKKEYATADGMQRSHFYS
ncbi:Pex13 protein [Pochonia chlamydosporia 170]|uniref:Peroxisomal membrane protein PEX13 n=1 Tax=Pochonia chlamydosporia 170 TaxID=1380566 RepID=A0A179FNW0_METCM|nr:Pex13 protein [Pochonia chlamydosporia 170]OAQ66968.1 Pex13 protein [Pochonia chlamydosporia 170]